MKKQTYRLVRHCRLGGVGIEVQLTEDEAIELTNETPDALKDSEGHSHGSIFSQDRHP